MKVVSPLMSADAWSKLDNIKDAEDMRYLIQPRGPGHSFAFRMATPPELIGRTNPFTGKPFGREIKLGLKTRHLPEARRLRDVYRGRVIELQEAARTGAELTLERAELWATAIAREEREGGGGPDDVTARDALDDLIWTAEAQPPSRRPSRTALKRFKKVASRAGYLLDDAVTRYLEERSPGNRLGNRPLGRTTVNDVRTAASYLKRFLDDDSACLQDVTRDDALRFRYDFLPALTSPRAPQGLSAKTVAKHITLLSGIWRWARQRGFVEVDQANPWEGIKGIAKVPGADRATRTLFTPEQASTILAALPRGHKLGDVFRLALITGCRAEEIASLTVSDLAPDCAGFSVRSGKTSNAERYVPLIAPGRAVLRERARRVAQGGEERVFPEWPVRASTGKSSALPAAFTRLRRKLLGAETDGSLALHSTRHTWRTIARRARVNEQDLNDLGGWAGPRTSNSVYDKGLLREQLVEAQELIGAQLQREGYLDEF